MKPVPPLAEDDGAHYDDSGLADNDDREMQQVISITSTTDTFEDGPIPTLPQHGRTINNDSNHDDDRHDHHQRRRRFQGWVVLVTANVLGIIALTFERRKGNSAEKWSISVLVLSFVLALFGTICYISTTTTTGSSILSNRTELVLVRRIDVCVLGVMQCDDSMGGGDQRQKAERF
jgi:hypothetical protein